MARRGDPMKPGRKPKAFMEWVEKIPFSTCWYWMGGSNRAGYGLVRHEGKHTLAHRASYMIHKGPVPNDLFVCHSCDEPSCVNPDHLWLGTHRDNHQDMMNKGRHGYRPHLGEANGRSRLTEEQVREIRARREAGEKLLSIATDYGLSDARVSEICLLRTWRHVA